MNRGNIINKKLAIFALSSVLAATSLTGCSKKTDNYSLTDVYKGLTIDDDLTRVDNYIDSEKFDSEDASEILMFKTNITDNDIFATAYNNSSELSLSELDDIFREAYINKDSATCNLAICLLSNLIIKANVIDAYNLDANKLEDFHIIGNSIKYNIDGTEFNEDEYGVSFKYDDETYKLSAKGTEAYDICSIARAAYYGELELVYANDSKYEIENAYNKLKDILLMDLKYKNEQNQKKVATGIIFKDTYKGLNFDGSFSFVKNDEKKNMVKGYLDLINEHKLGSKNNTKDSSTTSNEEKNNLPKKLVK